MSEQLLTDSVNKARNHMLIEDRKRHERERQQGRQVTYRPQQTPVPSVTDMGIPPYEIPPDGMYPMGPDEPMSDYVPIPPDMQAPEHPQESSDGLVYEEPLLKTSEKEILGFILEHGSVELKFDRDSKYYVEGESVSVAEFIDGTLAEDQAELVNTPYRLVYEEYFRMYDENLSDELIQKRLLDSMNPVISAVARDILIQRHQLTVKNYENSLTNIGTRLIQYVPKALIVYQSKKVEVELKSLMSKLMTVSADEQDAILVEITTLNKVKARLNNELGRV
jgi:hypothetical protein